MRVHSTLLLAAALCPTAAAAGSLRVDPVQVVINDDRRTAAVTVTNEASDPATLKISALAWSQVGGADLYEATDALVASPPIVRIEPGSKQIIRIGFRQSAAANRGSYRIVIEEVPRTDVAGVQVALRLNLPLFARIEEGKPSELRWSATQQANGTWVVQVENPGDRFMRVAPKDFTAASGLTYANNLRLGSVLPHSRLEWIVGKTPPVLDSTRWSRIAHRENDGEPRKLALKGD